MWFQRLLVVLGLVLFINACSKNSSYHIRNLDYLSSLKQNTKIHIISCIFDAQHQGVPVGVSRVLIGPKVDVPFNGNYLVTDSDGCFELPEAWADRQPVTIEAPGYIRATFLNTEPKVRDYNLQPNDGHERKQLKGATTGYGTLKKDGYIDFSLVIPLLSRFQLSQFNVSDLLSPEIDEIKIFGKSMTMPSNLSIPKQSENYIIPITIEKLTYRSFFRKSDNYKVMAGRGKFPFKEVIKDLDSGKSLFDVLNKLEFTSGGQIDVAITTINTQKDVGTTDYIFTPATTVEAPKYDAGLSMISLMLNQDGKLYVPSDVKTIESQQTVGLKGIANKQQTVMNLLGTIKNLQNGLVTLEGQTSTALVSASKTIAPQFMPLISKPFFDGSKITVLVPPAVKSIAPSGMYAALTEVEITDTATAYFEEKTRLWEIYSDEWVSSLVLPDFPIGINFTEQRRLEVSYLGQASHHNISQTGPEMVESSTHASKNTLDF